MSVKITEDDFDIALEHEKLQDAVRATKNALVMLATRALGGARHTKFG